MGMPFSVVGHRRGFTIVRLNRGGVVVAFRPSGLRLIAFLRLLAMAPWSFWREVFPAPTLSGIDIPAAGSAVELLGRKQGPTGVLVELVI